MQNRAPWSVCKMGHFCFREVSALSHKTETSKKKARVRERERESSHKTDIATFDQLLEMVQYDPSSSAIIAGKQKEYLKNISLYLVTYH